jgi:hypothetical protein
VILCVGAAVCGGDVPSPGPRVEVTPADGGAAYVASLLGFDGALIELKLENGGVRQEQAGAVKSLRFLAPPELPSPAKPAGDAKKTASAPGWTDADEQRLRALTLRDYAGPLTAAETELLFGLRERAPARDTELPLARLGLAARAAQHEAGKERLDSYIAMLQRRLKHAPNEDIAREALWNLTAAYMHKAPAVRPREALQRDVETMPDADLRTKMQAEIAVIFERLQRKPWRK